MRIKKKHIQNALEGQKENILIHQIAVIANNYTSFNSVQQCFNNVQI